MTELTRAMLIAAADRLSNWKPPVLCYWCGAMPEEPHAWNCAIPILTNAALGSAVAKEEA